MRTRHAVLQPDGTILWNGYTYKAFSYFSGELNLTYDDYNPVYVTNPDVPVLLSDKLVRFKMTSLGDGLILRFDSYVSPSYYCREDRYDELNSATDAPRTECCYSYYNYQTSGQDTYTLTPEQKTAVYSAMQKSEGFVDYGKVRRRDAIRLYASSEDGIFREKVCSIICSDKYTYFLELEYAPKYYVVPEEYYPIFDTIMIPYWESQGMTEDTFPTR